MSQFLEFFRRQSSRQVGFLITALVSLIVVVVITFYSLNFLASEFSQALNVNVERSGEPLRFDIEGFLNLNLIDRNSL